MFTAPLTNPAYPILDRWNTWARDNHRVDMCKAIWAIYALLEGRYFPPESKRAMDMFLKERVDSIDLKVVKHEIQKATEKHTARTVKDTIPELEIF